MPKLSRCSAPGSRRPSCAWGTLRRYLLEQSESAIHRVAVGEGTRYIGLKQDQVRSCNGLLIVLAPDTALQAAEVVFGAEVITAPLRQCLPHTVSAPGGWPAAR